MVCNPPTCTEPIYTSHGLKCTSPHEPHHPRRPRISNLLWYSRWPMGGVPRAGCATAPGDQTAPTTMIAVKLRPMMLASPGWGVRGARCRQVTNRAPPLQHENLLEGRWQIISNPSVHLQMGEAMQWLTGDRSPSDAVNNYLGSSHTEVQANKHWLRIYMPTAAALWCGKGNVRDSKTTSASDNLDYLKPIFTI